MVQCAVLRRSLLLLALGVSFHISNAEDSETPPGTLYTAFNTGSQTDSDKPPAALDIVRSVSCCAGNYEYQGAAQYSHDSGDVELTTNQENSVGAIWSKEVGILWLRFVFSLQCSTR